MEGHEDAGAKIFDDIFPLVLLELNHVYKISFDLTKIEDFVL